ncbi:hypothetical protein ACEQ8H_008886 [Pleosporales sp. CAS-2024a]
MAKDDKKSLVDEYKDIPHERTESRPDFSTPPARKQLPKALQDTLNDDEKLWEVLYEGKAEDTTDTSIRYAAYATRVRTIMLSAHRYVAYTSDIGESFRPIAHPYLVKGAYGVSWLYLLGDVGHEGYKAYCRNQRTLFPEKYLSLSAHESGVTGQHVTPGVIPAIEDYRAVMAQRATFQAVASMGLPAFTIHSIVRYSGRALKDAKNKTLRTWGPIGLGLAAVPFLPYMFDEPVEHATEWLFYNGFKAVGGEAAVAGRPVTGAKELRKEENQAGKLKEL